MPRVLVTGASGFTGFYVLSELRDRGFDIVDIPQVSIDFRDYEAVLSWFESEQPNYVIHLAAISSVEHNNINEIYETNLLGTINLLKALVESLSPVQRVIIASSANVYGNSKVEKILESQIPTPENHYGVSKYSMELAALRWSQQIPIRIVRPFNYTGVGQSKQFLIPKIVDHFRRGKTSIELGNIDVYRDFSDVRDVARWYVDLLTVDGLFNYVNFCSGQLTSLRDIIDMLNNIAGYEIKVNVNPSFVRSNEIKRLCGDNCFLDTLIKSSDRCLILETLAWMYYNE